MFYHVKVRDELCQTDIESKYFEDLIDAVHLALVRSSGGAHRYAEVRASSVEYAIVGPVIARYRDGKEVA